MITYPRKPISLSLNSSDLSLCTQVDTAATLYQKSPDCFHLLLSEPPLPEAEVGSASSSTDVSTDVNTNVSAGAQPRLLWLEISPYRLIMTMQSNSKFSYRHWLERGIYGMSRYWLQDEALGQGGQLRLRNFTRHLQIDGDTLPTHLSVEYELWANRVPMGRYQLDLQVHPD